MFLVKLVKKVLFNSGTDFSVYGLTNTPGSKLLRMFPKYFEKLEKSSLFNTQKSEHIPNINLLLLISGKKFYEFFI